MNLHSLVVVALRFITLNFLLLVIIYLTPQLYLFSDAYRQDEFELFDAFSVVPLVIVFGLFLGAILIWIFSHGIARLVIRGLPKDASVVSLSLVDCYSVVFLGIGLYYFVGYFPDTLTWAHYLIKLAATNPGDSWKDEVDWYSFWSTFLPFAIGTLLFLNGRKWSQKIARSHLKKGEASHSG
ncbi:hypothetical protein [Puniceicoccus vermicola]|uniref:Uncharacterized protein n=1 Tax=Puniceicoccus vermicola TaxID=388746 RepID=A0A7X1AWF1_9BACT|nr:hypothetical protein [Puniceicoccus vermicola]MBC2601255.1 hypothetical protein [Puniceicoccus vermicola]